MIAEPSENASGKAGTEGGDILMGNRRERLLERMPYLEVRLACQGQVGAGTNWRRFI